MSWAEGVKSGMEGMRWHEICTILLLWALLLLNFNFQVWLL